MLKNNWSNKIFAGRKSSWQNKKITSHGNNKGKSQDFLSNIVEEGSLEDLPKTFEQEEQYLDDCLKSMRNSNEDIQESEVEEYDFDDFNSIASTASIMSPTSDNDDRLNISSPTSISPERATSPPQRMVSPKPRNGLSSIERATSPHRMISPEPGNGFSSMKKDNKVNKHYQNSLSRVQNWDRLGRSGAQEDWSQVLIQASEAGDLITVQNAISHLGADKQCLINARDDSGNTPLHKAAENGKLQCLQWIVKRAPKEAVAIRNNDDITPAVMAVQFGQVKCLEWLVHHTNACHELQKKSTSSLLHHAAYEGQEECLRFLLTYLQSHELNVKDLSDSNGITPAHMAAREGHLECLQTLVEYNHSVTCLDCHGYAPSDYAFKAGQTTCGRYLIVMETCVDLTTQLDNCLKENEELRNRLQVLDNYNTTHMPDRPEAVGGDQSDSSSSISVDSTIYPSIKTPRFVDTRYSSGAPDGESPKGAKREGNAYEFQSNGYVAPSPTPIKPVKQPRDSSTVRRRGSFPKCWGTASDGNQSKKNNQSQSKNEQSVSSEVTSPRLRATSSVAKKHFHPKVHFEDSRGEILLAPSESSSNSVNSSRSQSPYRSDRSMASSAETVLVTTIEHSRTPYKHYIAHQNNNDTISNGFEGNKRNENQPQGLARNGLRTTQSNTSSNGHFTHSEARTKSFSHSTPIRPTKQRVDDFELSLDELSANQRRSWHGSDLQSSIPRTIPRPVERRAQVSWNSQSRSYSGRESFDVRNVRSTAPGSYQNRDQYSTYGSCRTHLNERPWYETEDIEL